ncbi:MAG: hypothetical protein AAF961_12705 [Planctomycetota bacterium]
MNVSPDAATQKEPARPTSNDLTERLGSDAPIRQQPAGYRAARKKDG